MHRIGIPASITLAQGMFESQYGDSPLAIHANNHFGMKCKSDWAGDTYHYDDDQVGECFKKYPTVYDSYKDHSNHIKGRTWYSFLFILPATDYVAWAIGLQKAGYATDTLYAQKLTALIERYGLHELDLSREPAAPQLSGVDININKANSGNIKRSFQDRQQGGGEPQNTAIDNTFPQSPFRNVAIGKSDLNSLNIAVESNGRPQTTEGEHLRLSGAPAVVVDAQQIENSIKRPTAENRASKAANPVRVGTMQDIPTETQADYFNETPSLNERYTAPSVTNNGNNSRNVNDNTPTTIATSAVPQAAYSREAEKTTTQVQTPVQTSTQMQPMSMRAAPEETTASSENVSNSNMPTARPTSNTTATGEVSYKKPVFENDCKSVTFDVPVMPEKIARMYDIELSLLLKYNRLQDKKQAFPANTPILLSLPVHNH